jgi:hypothetical protein
MTPGAPAAATLALLTAAGTAVATAAGSVRRKPAPCPPPHARVLAHDRDVRVWSSGGLGGTIVACDARRRTALTLTSPARHLPFRSSASGFRLAGDVVGYVRTTFGVDSGSSRLVIADVAARRWLREVPAGGYVDAGLISREAVEALIVTTRGSAAWITSRSERGVAGPSAVHLAARAGPVLLLDEGPGIEPASLRLEGATLSFDDGGVRHTHAMP